MTEARQPELAAAYKYCRSIARREAKNFYWSFRVLSRHKSDAMCAVYAFMRKADDLADDESLSIEERRRAMAAWTGAWRASRKGDPNNAGASENAKNPLFLALNDTQQCFGISDSLLEELVAGTTMDLEAQPQGTRLEEVMEVVEMKQMNDAGTRPRSLHVYQNQEALEAYCYLVASVVGLVCIRIFGYTDPRAEAYAIDTGKAFQLTNVMRDVREDAERGRVYLPATLLEEFDVSLERLLRLTQGERPSEKECAMLAVLGSRTEDLYRSADKLLPLLDADARPALRVLVSIYHRLLERMRRDEGIVFRQRVSVPTVEKISILGRGVIGSLLARSA